MSQSNIFLLPCPIAENKIDTLPDSTIQQIHSTSHFIVERAKTARHFIKNCNHPTPIQEVIIEEIDKHDKTYHIQVARKWMKENIDFGIISEAGCPGIADPGSQIIAEAHRMGAKVKPFVGPSSILLALMASGMNGQKFTFEGYLPRKQPMLKNELNRIQSTIQKQHSSHIFIETPYRNQSLFDEIIKYCQGNLRLHISLDVTGNEETCITKTIQEWKKSPFQFKEKLPCIFILG